MLVLKESINTLLGTALEVSQEVSLSATVVRCIVICHHWQACFCQLTCSCSHCSSDRYSLRLMSKFPDGVRVERCYDAVLRRMQDELSKLRREMLRRQTYSFRDSGSPVSVSDSATQNSFQQSAYRHRQNELERVVSEMQHLQQEVARLRQERDAARMQRGDRPASPAKQALNKRPGGE